MFISLVFSKGNTKMQHIAGWLALLFAGIHLARGLYGIITNTELPIYSDEYIHILTGYLYIIVSFTFPLLLLFIIKEYDNQILKEANATKDKFFSIIAHDLKSPFNSIIGFSKILSDNTHEYDQSKIKEFAGIISQSSELAMELLMNLMDWSRSQTGQMKYNPEQIELSKISNEMETLFNNIAQEKSIIIKWKLSDDTSYLMDKVMINIILRNLISNAIKFTMPNGEISIEAKKMREHLLFSVIDNGVGIAQDTTKTLFDIGKNHSTTGTNDEMGTGLGLILCKEFVEKHGGRIWVESVLGEGSTFYFSIPVNNRWD
jgi:signal transduction histidine kinase